MAPDAGTTGDTEDQSILATTLHSRMHHTTAHNPQYVHTTYHNKHEHLQKAALGRTFSSVMQ